VSIQPHRVVVIGGGITGLTAAYSLTRVGNGRPVEVTVLEASDRVGGKLRTAELAGIPVEDGADSFVARKPWALKLCGELGLGDDLVAPAPGGAYVWSRGRLVAYLKGSAFGIPSDAEDLLRWRGMSRRGKWRALVDLIRPKGRVEGDESIRSLAARRLGSEAADVLVGPLLAGIHAGDPARLSVQATFPELARWERDFGSLIRGARAASKAAREREDAGDPEPMFGTVWTGLSTLIEALVEAIGPTRIRTGAPAMALREEAGRWHVRIPGSELHADAVIVATPAFESAKVLEPVLPAAARELAAIPYASTAVVSLAYPKETLGRLPPGTGVIVPPAAGATITASTWLSSKWPRPEHQGRAVLRCYVGRAGADDIVDRGDEELVRLVAADVERICPIGEPPEATRVARWPDAMPQYEVGHLDRLARVDEALTNASGLVLTGSAFRGVGIADCVRQGEEAADRVRTWLGGSGHHHDHVHQEAIS
jgi:oxygen-dependent protoporphyrinogen oxidase